MPNVHELELSYSLYWKQCGEESAVCRYSEVLQRAELKRHVLALAYGYAAALTYAVTCVGDMRNPGATPLTSPLLAPINLLLQWLATQPDCVRCVPLYSLCAKRQHATCGMVFHCMHGIVRL